MLEAGILGSLGLSVSVRTTRVVHVGKYSDTPIKIKEAFPYLTSAFNKDPEITVMSVFICYDFVILQTTNRGITLPPIL